MNIINITSSPLNHFNGGGVSSNLNIRDLKNQAYTSNRMEVYAL